MAVLRKVPCSLLLRTEPVWQDPVATIPSPVPMKHDAAPHLFHGSCLCGAVAYEARSEIKAVSHCHCSMCRKAHGAAFGTYGSVPVGDFVITQGVEVLCSRASSPGVTRTFCSMCGSPLTWRSIHGGAASWISFSLGTLDTPFTPLKQRHIHLASETAWHAAADSSSRG